MKRLADEWFVLISPKRQLRREVRRANDARDCGDWGIAAERYRQAIRLDPDNAALWMQVGHACKEAADLEGARVAYARAESLVPDDVDTHIQLGHFHKLIGQNEHAARYYQAAVDGGSSDEHALHFLAKRDLHEVEAASKISALQAGLSTLDISKLETIEPALAGPPSHRTQIIAGMAAAILQNIQSAQMRRRS